MQGTNQPQPVNERAIIQSLENACYTLRNELQTLSDKNKKAVEMLTYRRERAGGKVIHFYNRLIEILQ